MHDTLQWIVYVGIAIIALNIDNIMDMTFGIIRRFQGN